MESKLCEPDVLIMQKMPVLWHTQEGEWRALRRKPLQVQPGLPPL